MTTPPKARRYHASASEAVAPDEQAAAAVRPAAGDPGPVRIEVTRRQQAAPQGDADSDGADMMARLSGTGPVDDGFGSLNADRNRAEDQPAKDADLEAKLAAIRAENLSERNLRIARRIAALHQIPVSSDEEAILRLRERGIDPSQRATIGKVLSGEGAATPDKTPGNAPKGPRNAKSLVPVGKPRGALTADGEGVAMPLPSREALTEEKRAAEIYRIQRDLARRRRKRMLMLAMRLLVFVFLPTAAVSWYYTMIASPLYATVSQFQIQSADGNSGGGIGGLLGAGGMAANTDSVGVQSYLTSREAMMRLNEELGFTRAFQDPAMDAIRRLPEDATNEAAFRVYQNSVKIGYDPTEGVLNMEVIAPDPVLSREFSLALIRYAEEQVDRFTARLREDQMRGAIENYEDAEAKMLQAQRRVQELQERLGVLDPQAESSVVMGQISSLESQLTNRQLELGQLLSNPSPVQSRVDAARGDIERLQQQIAQTRLQLTEGNEMRRSLTAISGELRVAEAELATRQELLAAAAAQMETARIEANKQVRYLSLSVAPVAPDEATYPKAFQNSIVAFLLFAGIYLMLSLTASILREQVST
ncbi:capsule biosynthesis protein [Paracoccus sp. (in: a-proteobacteria)]|uniref:capsule biosynthesis protein n=1 Tax=Paracoccus sp. TaxID=267 RepID=UPI00272B4A69|nr:capsule biosynthesis protein [Paracoccus sp. (in: a-proteobacteria)]